MANKNMIMAQQNKNDEFYTQLVDIENELRHYHKHFKGKVIFMNADDPEESNFWQYFYLNFKFFGLKKIIATHYDPEKPSYKMEYDGNEVIKTDLDQNGDFRSVDAINLLKESDIVVTNPPFSLFREYIAQLYEYEKDFIVIGNMNAVSYQEIFPRFQNDEIWMGQNYGTMEFVIPEDAPTRSGQRIDGRGIRYQKFGNIAWYTNLDIPRLHEKMILFRVYNEEDYLNYDNYDAIEVSRVADIPEDYDGIMGVPITYISKHNLEQFEIVGIMDRQNTSGLRTKKYTRDDTDRFNDLNRAGAIKLSDGTYKSIYTRILIKRKG